MKIPSVIESELNRLELGNNLTLKEQNTSFEVIRPIMRGLVNEVGTAIRNHNGYIYIPVLGKKLETLETA
jgi:hypothetical protein